MKKATSSSEPPELRILTIRGERVILDADLARLYGVPTHRFNEAFKRNRRRFPDDFVFQMTAKEIVDLRAQIAASSFQAADSEVDVSNSSQIAMSSRRGRDYRPWAFTEHGALMAANILRSPQAVQMSVFVVRAFVRQREQLSVNADVLRRLAEIDRTLLRHDDSIVAVLNIIKSLIAPHPSPLPPPPSKKRIGFQP